MCTYELTKTVNMMFCEWIHVVLEVRLYHTPHIDVGLCFHPLQCVYKKPLDLKTNLRFVFVATNNMNFHQDWEPVVFRKKAVKENDKNAVKEALRTGKPVETVTKTGNREYSDRARKLEADLDPTQDVSTIKLAALNKLNLATRQEMTRVRTQKKITQVQLAQLANVRPQVIQELESGKPVQDRSILVQVNRILGTKLKFET